MSNRFEPLAFLREIEAIVNPPWVREILKGAEVLGAKIAPVMRGIDEISRAIVGSPEVAQAMRMLEAFQPAALELSRNFEVFLKWVDEAPEKLKAAFADAGVVPHPSLSLPDIQRLIRDFESNGADSAVALLLTLHEELLAEASFRSEVQARWEAVGRWAVMSDALSALDSGLYFAAVATAIVQAEGIVAQLFRIRGRAAQKVLIDKLNSMHVADDADSLFGPLAEAVSKGFFGEFWHGFPIVGLSRHAVTHGADVAFGTRKNAITVIVWVDYLLILAETDGVRSAVFRARSLAWYRKK